jgi:purine-nucleoside phosphorylase
MSTPHITAQPGDISDVVLFPGDPLRARFVAKQFLDEVVEVNACRNMLGYTGLYQGRRVSVMGSGMGIPSCAIYATELARVYGVQQIIRIGTCAGVGDVGVGDILVAQSGSTDSNFNRLHFGGHDLAACADFGLMSAVMGTAIQKQVPVRAAPVFSTDCFYGDDPDLVGRLVKHRILGIDMETAGLYGLAMREGAKALSVLTVSDHLQRDDHMPPADRERGLSVMAGLVLDSLTSG